MAAGSMAKATTPEPFSTSKTSNWVARAGGLPPYIQHVAHDLVEKRGMPESRAIAMAIGIIKNWAHGHPSGGEKGLQATTIAAAKLALSEWEAKKAKAHISEAEIAQPFLDRFVMVEGMLGPLGQPTTQGRRDLVRAAKDLLEAPDGTPGRIAMLGGPASSPREQRRTAEALLNEADQLREIVKGLDVEVAEATTDPVTAAEERVDKARKRSPRKPKKDDSTNGRNGSGDLILKAGATGERVNQAQQRLSALGYETNVDGSYGPKTATTVKGFQADHGLKQDGVLGDNTRAAMRGTTPEDVTAKRAAKDPDGDGDGDDDTTAAGDTDHDVFSWLTKGKGVGEKKGDPAVKKAQTALTAMGAFVGDAGPDGRFGPETEAATKRVQRRYGLKPDGLIGEKTNAVLETHGKGEDEGKAEPKADRKKKDKDVEEAAGTPGRQPLVSLVAGRGAAPVGRGGKKLGQQGKGGGQGFEQQHPRGRGGLWIKKGDSGPAVKRVQKKVGATADGKFGPQTEAAVRAYQQAHGLKVTGKVGSQTAAAVLGHKNPASVTVGPLGVEQRAKLGGSGTTGSSSSSSSGSSKSGSSSGKSSSSGSGGSSSSGSGSSRSGGSSSSGGSPSIPNSAGVKPGGVLRLGSSGKVVNRVQAALGIPTTGQYNAATVRAIKEYQRKHGLQVDGVLGTQTAASLLGDGGSHKVGTLTGQDIRRLLNQLNRARNQGKGKSKSGSGKGGSSKAHNAQAVKGPLSPGGTAPGAPLKSASRPKRNTNPKGNLGGGVVLGEAAANCDNGHEINASDRAKAKDSIHGATVTCKRCGKKLRLKPSGDSIKDPAKIKEARTPAEELAAMGLELEEFAGGAAGFIGAGGLSHLGSGGGGLSGIDFNPDLHPRDREGKFMEVLGKLVPAAGDSAHLPGGTKVEKSLIGFKLHLPGGETKRVATAGAAAKEALSADHANRMKEATAEVGKMYQHSHVAFPNGVKVEKGFYEGGGPFTVTGAGGSARFHEAADAVAAAHKAVAGKAPRPTLGDSVRATDTAAHAGEGEVSRADRDLAGLRTRASQTARAAREKPDDPDLKRLARNAKAAVAAQMARGHAESKGALRESALTLEEASVVTRALHAFTSLVEIRRLPNGQFAPKGEGQILRPGEAVKVGSGVGKVDAAVHSIHVVSGPDRGRVLKIAERARMPKTPAAALGEMLRASRNPTARRVGHMASFKVSEKPRVTPSVRKSLRGAHKEAGVAARAGDHKALAHHTSAIASRSNDELVATYNPKQLHQLAVLSPPGSDLAHRALALADHREMRDAGRDPAVVAATANLLSVSGGVGSPALPGLTPDEQRRKADLIGTFREDGSIAAMGDAKYRELQAELTGLIDKERRFPQAAALPIVGGFSDTIGKNLDGLMSTPTAQEALKAGTEMGGVTPEKVTQLAYASGRIDQPTAQKIMHDLDAGLFSPPVDNNAPADEDGNPMTVSQLTDRIESTGEGGHGPDGMGTSGPLVLYDGSEVGWSPRRQDDARPYALTYASGNGTDRFSTPDEAAEFIDSWVRDENAYNNWENSLDQPSLPGPDDGRDGLSSPALGDFKPGDKVIAHTGLATAHPENVPLTVTGHDGGDVVTDGLDLHSPENLTKLPLERVQHPKYGSGGVIGPGRQPGYKKVKFDRPFHPAAPAVYGSEGMKVKDVPEGDLTKAGLASPPVGRYDAGPYDLLDGLYENSNEAGKLEIQKIGDELQALDDYDRPYPSSDELIRRVGDANAAGERQAAHDYAAWKGAHNARLHKGMASPALPTPGSDEAAIRRLPETRETGRNNTALWHGTLVTLQNNGYEVLPPHGLGTDLWKQATTRRYANVDDAVKAAKGYEAKAAKLDKPSSGSRAATAAGHAETAAHWQGQIDDLANAVASGNSSGWTDAKRGKILGEFADVGHLLQTDLLTPHSGNPDAEELLAKLDDVKLAFDHPELSAAALKTQGPSLKGQNPHAYYGTPEAIEEHASASGVGGLYTPPLRMKATFSAQIRQMRMARDLRLFGNIDYLRTNGHRDADGNYVVTDMQGRSWSVGHDNNAAALLVMGLSSPPPPVAGDLNRAWSTLTDAGADTGNRQDAAETVSELTGAPLGEISAGLGLASPAPPTVPSGYNVNTEKTGLEDLPIGTTFALKGGERFVVHKDPGNDWMITKPVDEHGHVIPADSKGKSVKVLRGVFPPSSIGPPSPDYADEVPDDKNADALAGQLNTSGDGGDDALYNTLAASVGMAAETTGEATAPKVEIAPPTPKNIARTGKGNLRNFKAMGDAKLIGVADGMQGEDDPPAVEAINSELNDRGLDEHAIDVESGEAPEEPQLEAEPERPGGNPSFEGPAGEFADPIAAMTAGSTHQLPNGTQVTKTASAYVVTSPDGGSSLADTAGHASEMASNLDSQLGNTGAHGTTLNQAAAQLGPEWSPDSVSGALNDLADQGVSLDPAVESPDTLTAVIQAAGLKPPAAPSAPPAASASAPEPNVLVPASGAIEVLPSGGIKVGNREYHELNANDNIVTPDEIGGLAGKSVVVTGVIDGETRKTITKKLEDAGAQVKGAIGAAGPDVLIVGVKAGSKLKKARELGLPILPAEAALEVLEALVEELTEAELDALLGGDGTVALDVSDLLG